MTDHYVMVGGSMKRIFQLMLLGPWISRRSDKKMGLLMHKPNAADPEILAGMFESSAPIPVINRSYPLEEVAAAIQYLGEGKVLGKLVIVNE